MSVAITDEMSCPLLLPVSHASSSLHPHHPLLYRLFFGRLNLLIKNILATFLIGPIQLFFQCLITYYSVSLNFSSLDVCLHVFSVLMFLSSCSKHNKLNLGSEKFSEIHRTFRKGTDIHLAYLVPITESSLKFLEQMGSPCKHEPFLR